MIRPKVFFDGGCRPNPGTIEIAVVAGGQTQIVRDVGQGTSLDAEWVALIHAVRFATSLGLRHYVLVGDAANVVAQANGDAKCRGDAVHHLLAFRALAGDAGTPPVRFVKRSKNLAGNALQRLHPR